MLHRPLQAAAIKYDGTCFGKMHTGHKSHLVCPLYLLFCLIIYDVIAVTDVFLSSAAVNFATPPLLLLFVTFERLSSMSLLNLLSL